MIIFAGKFINPMFDDLRIEYVSIFVPEFWEEHLLRVPIGLNSTINCFSYLNLLEIQGLFREINYQKNSSLYIDYWWLITMGVMIENSACALLIYF